MIYTSQSKAWNALNTLEKVVTANSSGTLERFWAKVDKRDENECWNWTAGCGQARGYGQFNYGGFNMHAHRAAWMIHYGVIPADLHVCHHCDNVICVNPKHLWLGTNKQNHDDKNAKLRQNHGIRHGSCKLTEEQVYEIRDSDLDYSELGCIYDIHPSQARGIKLRTKWTFLPEHAPACQGQ